MEPPGQGSSPSPINARVLVAGGCGPSAGLAVARGKPTGDLSSPWRRGRAGEGRLEGRLLLTEPPVALERLGNLGGGERERGGSSAQQDLSCTHRHTHPAHNKRRKLWRGSPAPGGGGEPAGLGGRTWPRTAGGIRSRTRRTCSTVASRTEAASFFLPLPPGTRARSCSQLCLMRSLRGGGGGTVSPAASPQTGSFPTGTERAHTAQAQTWGTQGSPSRSSTSRRGQSPVVHSGPETLSGELRS